MAGMDRPDAVGLVVQGIEEGIVLHARQAEQRIDAVRDQPLDDDLGRGSSDPAPSLLSPCRASPWLATCLDRKPSAGNRAIRASRRQAGVWEHRYADCGAEPARRPATHAPPQCGARATAWQIASIRLRSSALPVPAMSNAVP